MDFCRELEQDYLFDTLLYKKYKTRLVLCQDVYKLFVGGKQTIGMNMKINSSYCLCILLYDFLKVISTHDMRFR